MTPSASAREISGTLSLFWSGPDRIEAAIRAGEDETARAWLEAFEPWARHSEATWALAGIAHCRALMSTDDAQTKQFFGEALELHVVALRPFERARTELAFGEHLRRARHRVESREHLNAALEGFEQLGAEVWAARARAELRASGQTSPQARLPARATSSHPRSCRSPASSQTGLTNREVAAQLFVSPRTVDFHLRNVFRKLGITTRTELARLDPPGRKQVEPSGKPGDFAGASLAPASLASFSEREPRNGGTEWNRASESPLPERRAGSAVTSSTSSPNRVTMSSPSRAPRAWI